MVALVEKIKVMRKFFFRSGAHAEALDKSLDISIKVLEGVKELFGNDTIMGASASIPINGLLAVLKRIKINEANKKHLELLNERIIQLYNSVLGPMYNYELHKGDQLSETLLHSARTLFANLDKCTKKCNETWAHGISHAKSDEKIIQTLSEDIKNIVDIFLVQGTVITQLDTARSLNRLHEDRVRLVSDLPRAKKATHDSSHINDIPICHKETRKDVLEKIDEWIKSDDASKRVFWLNGIVGSGKTTISRTVIKEATSMDDVWVASFFFSRGDVHSSDALLVFPTLAYQLAHFHPKIMVSLSKMVFENMDCAFHPLNKQFTEFIEEPLKALNDGTHTILLVLDAFDECASKDGASAILKLLLTWVPAMPCNLRILITSRPEEHIRSLFTIDQGHAEYALHNIEKEVLRNDIGRFLQNKLEDIFTRRHLSMPDGNIMKSLISEVDGLFILAVSVLRFIDSNLVDDPKLQLDIILNNRNVFHVSPHSEIDSSYMQVLDLAVPKADNSFDMIKERFLRVVGTIVTLREPLPLSALAAFIGLSEHNILTALNPLHSVIFVPLSRDKGSRVYHQSFIDFITEKSRCRDDRFFIDVPSLETLHAFRCLEFMTIELKSNMAGMVTQTTLNNEVPDLGRQVKKAISGELRYACINWVSHIVATKSLDTKPMSLLSDFIRNCMLYWMESMSLLGEVPHAILMMKDVYTWSKKMNLDSGLLELLHDAYRCLLQHRDALIRCALDIYHSIFLFLPRDTALYRVYKDVIGHPMKIISGAQSRWSSCLSNIHYTTKVRDNLNVSLAISPDGSRMATATIRGNIALWNIQNGALVETKFENSVMINSLAYLQDGVYLASGSNDGKISLWDVTTGICAHKLALEGDNGRINILATSPNKPLLASASRGKNIRVWDTDRLEFLFTLSCNSEVKSLVFFPDGNKLVSVSEYEVLTWDMDTRQLVTSLNDPWSRSMTPNTTSALPCDVAISRTGKWLAVLYTEVISVFDTDSHDVDPIYKWKCSFARSISFSPDDAWLVSSGYDSIRLWETKNSKFGKCFKMFQHPDVHRAIFTPDGTRLVSISINGTCRLWDLSFPKEKDDVGSVDALKFSGDGSMLAVVRNRNPEVWNVPSWKQISRKPQSWSNPKTKTYLFDDFQVAIQISPLVIMPYATQSDTSTDEAIGFKYESMHDHIHMVREANNTLQCTNHYCEDLSMRNGYRFTLSDRWLWVVEEGVERRIVHIPDEYDIEELKGCSRFVAVKYSHGRLLVLDTHVSHMSCQRVYP